MLFSFRGASGACFAYTACLAAIGCASESGAFELAAPSREEFERDVYPVLLRDCAMSRCHGAEERFFRVVGPGRVRLSQYTSPLDPATAAEITISYERARSQLDVSGQRQAASLLSKPLERAAGGATHGGQDRFGRNVYPNKQAPGYLTLAAWVLSENAPVAP
ncbi:MAG: hypothetical protein RL701_1734 [Pseudomonadota bacterium]